MNSDSKCPFSTGEDGGAMETFGQWPLQGIRRDVDTTIPNLNTGGFVISRPILGGGFKHFGVFIPKIGEMIQFDEHTFSNVLKPPTSI